MFSDFYVAALCNVGFMLCILYIEQVWPPVIYAIFVDRPKSMPWNKALRIYFWSKQFNISSNNL